MVKKTKITIIIDDEEMYFSPATAKALEAVDDIEMAMLMCNAKDFLETMLKDYGELLELEFGPDREKMH